MRDRGVIQVSLDRFLDDDSGLCETLHAVIEYEITSSPETEYYPGHKEAELIKLVRFEDVKGQEFQVGEHERNHWEDRIAEWIQTQEGLDFVRESIYLDRRDHQLHEAGL